MGDKSPENQIKIGNLTVKLNPNNQQKNRRDSNYDRNYYYKNNDRNNESNDKYNDRYNDRYNEKDRRRDRDSERDRDRDRDRDRERNKYQNDNKNYNRKEREKGYKSNESNDRYLNKRNDYDYDNKREKYNKNKKNKSNSNSRSESRHRHSYNRNKSRSRSRTHSHHDNKNKKYINEQNNKNNLNKNNNNNNINNSQNNNNNNMNMPFNNNLQNNQNINMGLMNQMNPNFFNNYNEFFKNFYQMNNKLGNNNTNNFIVPIGIPMNYFYNPNFNKMNQMNKMNNNNQNNNNNNNNSQTNNHSQNQNQNQSQKEEPSNTILITDLDTNITKETLEDIFREKCLKLQISMPIDIRLVEALNIAYIIFPSVTSCVIVYNSLVNQKILINGKYFQVQFSPNLTSKYSNNRDTLTYVTQISSNTSLTKSMETTVHEDWYCVYCDSKNFSRRTICFKCQKPKSINCRVVPVIKQKKIILGANGEILPNNSIIIQGKQIQYSNEGEVFIFTNIFLFFLI